MLLMMALLSDKSGREHAKKEIGEFKSQRGNYVTLYTPLLSTPTKARQIICGNSFCAFWLGDESLIVPFGSIQRIAAYRDTQVR